MTALRLVPPEAEADESRTRVCGISFTHHDHADRCVRAWREREHPPWSSYASGFRVARIQEVRRR